MTKFDVLTVGNAIVDIIARCDDQFLIDHKITKAAMNLIDAERAELLYAHMGPALEASGVELISDNVASPSGGRGVRLRAPKTP